MQKAVLASFASLLLGGGGAPAQDVTFSEVLDVDLVNLEVHAVDRNGRPVSDLTPEDFRVTEDGKKITISHFTPPARLGGTRGEDLAGSASQTTTEGAAGTARRPPPASGPSALSRLAILVDLDHANVGQRNQVLEELTAALQQYDLDQVVVATQQGGGLRVRLASPSSADDLAAQISEVMESSGSMEQGDDRHILQELEHTLGIHTNTSNSRKLRHGALDELLARVQAYAGAEHRRSSAAVSALQSLTSALGALPGRKALLYVGGGFPLRAGESALRFLAGVLENDQQQFAEGALADDSVGADEGESRRDMRHVGGATVNSLRVEVFDFDLSGDLAALAATANTNRVTIYALSTARTGSAIHRASSPVSAGALSMMSSQFASFESARISAAQQSLQFAAEATGGLASAPDAKVVEFVDLMAGDAAGSYSLAFAPSHAPDSRYHRISVKVARKGVRLRHREGYLHRSRDLNMGELMAAAPLFGAPHNDHGLQLAVTSGNEGQPQDGARSVVLALSIPLDSLDLLPAKDAHRADLDLYIMTLAEGRERSPLRRVPLPIRVDAAEREEARGKLYAANLPLELEPEHHTVVIGVVEQTARRFSIAYVEVRPPG